MSISPPSSPTSGCSGPNSPILSPRSKVKALLAGIDGDSEPENSGHAAASSWKNNDSPVKRFYPKPARREDPRSEDSDEDGPVVPQGRTARRLQSKAINEGEAASFQNEAHDETARERTKRYLMKRDGSDTNLSSKDRHPGQILAIPSAINDAQVVERELNAESVDYRTSATRHNKASPRSTTATSSPPPSSSKEGIEASVSETPPVNSRFQELVARKRAEREAREAEAEAKKEEKRSMIQQLDSFESSDEDSEREAGVEKTMTKHARPTRKASKKAIEEMNRETQRLYRNRQLAHEAKTKKKISKQSFLDRFNYRTSATPAPTTFNPDSSTAPTSAPASESEDAHHRSSPPTSPASPNDSVAKGLPMVANTGQVKNLIDPGPNRGEDNLPTLDEIFTQAALLDEAGATNEVPEPLYMNEPALPSSKPAKSRTPIRERLARHSRTSMGRVEDSDSDIDIVPVQKSRARLDAFKCKQQAQNGGGRSLQTLRALAHVHPSPVKKSSRSQKPSMSHLELQAFLQRQARQQAARERAEKIQELREKGVIIQTVEERTRDQAEVEDLLEKAQKEATEIREKEKRISKKSGTVVENGEDGLADTSEEDEDYEGIQGGDADLELSGSEEEADDSDEECYEESETGNDDALDRAEGLMAAEASGDERDEEEIEAGNVNDEVDGHTQQADHTVDEDEEANLPVPQRRTRNKVVLDDEEDGDGDGDQEVSPPLRPDVLQNPFQAAPVNPLQRTAGMLGLTQVFAATLADSQTPQPEGQPVDAPDSVGLLGTMPEPDLPVYDPEMIEDSQIVTNSLQDQDTSLPAEIKLDFAQSQVMREDTQDQLLSTQDLDLPDPSQDVGFAPSSPAGKRFVSPVPSTVDTVLLSPGVVPKGRLRRGTKVPTGESDSDEDIAVHAVQIPKRINQVSTSAFDVLKERQSKHKAQDKYNKKTTKAKEMVEEQAQESEDEYAGIGGASDDESEAENDEEVQKMIDESSINVDEQELAALHL